MRYVQHSEDRGGCDILQTVNECIVVFLIHKKVGHNYENVRFNRTIQKTTKKTIQMILIVCFSYYRYLASVHVLNLLKHLKILANAKMGNYTNQMEIRGMQICIKHD